MSQYECALCNLTTELEHAERVDLHRIINIFINFVTARFGVHAADVLIYDADTQALKYVGGRGFHSSSFESAAVRSALAGQVVRQNQWVRYADLRRLNNAWSNSRELVAEGFVTYLGIPLTTNAKLIGVLEFFQRESLNPSNEWVRAIDDIAAHGAFFINNSLVARQIQLANNQFTDAYDALIDGWALALELRDLEPKGHTKRVTEMTLEFAHIMGVGAPDLINVRRGALLHDMGKMGIPDSVLLKTDTLTDEEWKIMQQHPVIAHEQLSRIQVLKPAAVIPYLHHEKWDGTGYPCGLAGEQIPFVARLFSIVDVWDSLSSDRPYRKRWPSDRVSAYLREQAGKHFDPKLADTFVKLLENDAKSRGSAMGARGTRGEYLKSTFHV